MILSCDVTFNELEMLKLKVHISNSSNGTPHPMEFEKLLWFLKVLMCLKVRLVKIG